MITLNDKTYTCPIDVTLSFIGGKWKILILSHLYYTPDRGFSDIRNNLPGVSEKMLAQQLKELERDHLIEKKVIQLKPYRVHYNLSPGGRLLTPLIDQMSEYGVNYLKEHGIDYLKDQHIYK